MTKQLSQRGEQSAVQFVSTAEGSDVAHQRASPNRFLNAERIKRCVWIVLVTNLVILTVTLWADLHLQGKPLLGNDFRVFWAASKLGLDGHGADSYDIRRLFPIQQSVAPAINHAQPWQHWFYPPTFLLAVLPLALLPYHVSFILFNAAGLTFYLWVLRTVFPRRIATLIALSSPALMLTVVNGQNSLFTAGIAGLALALLERYPARAGMLLGLLVIKPHLALLFGVALMAGKAWRTLCWALGTGLSLVVVSVLAFSPQSVTAFFSQVHLAKSFAEQGLMPIWKMPTVFAAIRLLGLPVSVANGLHAVVALSVMGAVGWLWARQTPADLRKAALVLGCLMISPHLFDYDLMWLTWPIGWLTLYALRQGWRPGEKVLMILAWGVPIVGDVIAHIIGIQIAPFIILWLLSMALRRARLEKGASAMTVGERRFSGP